MVFRPPGLHSIGMLRYGVGIVRYGIGTVFMPFFIIQQKKFGICPVFVQLRDIEGYVASSA